MVIDDVHGRGSSGLGLGVVLGLNAVGSGGLLEVLANVEEETRDREGTAPHTFCFWSRRRGYRGRCSNRPHWRAWKDQIRPYGFRWCRYNRNAWARREQRPKGRGKRKQSSWLTVGVKIICSKGIENWWEDLCAVPSAVINSQGEPRTGEISASSPVRSLDFGELLSALAILLNLKESRLFEHSIFFCWIWWIKELNMDRTNL